MDAFTGRDLRALLETPRAWCVSLYQPTDRTGAAGEQHRPRFANLLRTAEGGLRAAGLDSAATEALLAPARALLADDTFWRRQGDGLAVFLAPGFCRAYRLPLAFDEGVVVARRFALRPLLPLFTGDGRCYVLALSQGAVRLLEGTREGLGAVPLPAGVPADFAAATRYDDPERQSQYYTGTPGTKGRAGAVFYGQEVESDAHKADLLRFCRQVDRGLRPLLHDEDAPLILAGVPYLLAIYRAANTYPHLLDGEIGGNPEPLGAATLGERAWALAGPHFAGERRAALARYRQLAGTGLASGDIRELVLAAGDGRVDSLFVAPTAVAWGAVDPAARTVEIHSAAGPGDEDLAEAAVAATLAAGGRVYPVAPAELPDGAAAPPPPGHAPDPALAPAAGARRAAGRSPSAAGVARPASQSRTSAGVTAGAGKGASVAPAGSAPASARSASSSAAASAAPTSRRATVPPSGAGAVAARARWSARSWRRW
ncbi:MAG TPA: hypothetical protein VFW96_01935 [Thermomicrobiales bacterium]|nr:hypothetical protein [Thermomicrobiales bacterium]